MFFKDDEETLSNTCWALAHLLPGIIIEDALIRRLTFLLQYPSAKVQRVIVRIFSNLLEIDNVPTRVSK